MNEFLPSVDEQVEEIKEIIEKDDDYAALRGMTAAEIEAAIDPGMIVAVNLKRLREGVAFGPWPEEPEPRRKNPYTERT